MTTNTPVKKNPCFDRKPFAKSYPAQDGWRAVMMAPAYGPARQVVSPKMVQIPNRFEDKCHYSESPEGQRDPGCVGCRHRHTIA